MADVCLFLEGTYPYVSGGVSGCVHQLVSMLPNTTFTLVFIGARSDQPLTMKYKLPPNVVGLQEVFLFDDLDRDKKRNKRMKDAEYEALCSFHDLLHRAHIPGKGLDRESIQSLVRTFDVLFPTGGRQSTLYDALSSEQAWERLLSEYSEMGPEMPFVDFFYTWRTAHLPIYHILSQNYPRAKVYHSLCTGYAGVAATIAAYRAKAPLFVTEHGIYAHERAIELAEADWLYKPPELALTAEDAAVILKRWWMDMFRNLSKITYAFSSEIITLFNGNGDREATDGADRKRIRIIPNGINRRFNELRRSKPSWGGAERGKKFKIGFIGRVVPIKDVKLLIKVMRIVASRYKDVECEIIGPTDEDPGYFEQCKDLVEFLELKDVVKFLGKTDVTKVYPDLDLVMITSISEAQPLVILEANCAGVPVVSTKVGCCEDLLNGATEEDRELGTSGLIAPIGNADAIAEKVLQIIGSAETWESMSLAGIKRVAKFYDERDLTSRYGVLYREHAAGVASVSGLPPGVLPWQESASD